MSELLQNWLNNEVGLSTNVSNFEKDFSSGYLFGEILHKFWQADFEQFQNKNSHQAKIANFKSLEPILKALGIKFNATLINAVMNGERGAALRLLYQLKMASERSERPVLALQASALEMQASVGWPGASMKVRQARVEKLTRKFELEKHKQEIVAFEMDHIEQAHVEEQRQIHRFSLRERLRQNRAAKDEWEARGHELWQENMKVRMTRENEQMRFSDKVLRTQQEKELTLRRQAAEEVLKGTQDFESGLVTLGLTKTKEDVIPEDSSEEETESAEKLLAQTSKVASAKELVEALQAKLPTGQELNYEANLFMRKIKESKEAGAIARRERERRRRRVLVEQQREQEMLEENQLEQVLLEKLGRESIEESAISYRSWRVNMFEEVFVRNRQARQQQYIAQKRADKEEALKRDQDLWEEMIESLREQEERERVRYRAVERLRHAKRREKLREEMEGILELIVQMSFASLQQEQLTDQEEVDSTLWREWVSLFEENLPVMSLPSLQLCAEEPAPLTALPEPTGLANLHAVGATLNSAALRDFMETKGQWKVPLTDEATEPEEVEEIPASQPPLEIFDCATEVAATLEEAQGISFASKLSSELDFVEKLPVNYRLGVVVASMIDRKYKEPPPQPPPSMPEVPLRLVITGKPYAGKKTVARRLAEAYNLEIIDLDEVVRECLAASKPDDYTRERINREMQVVGLELNSLLEAGEAIPDELYVKVVVTKIRTLFEAPDAADDAAAEPVETEPPEATARPDTEGSGAEVVDAPGDDVTEAEGRGNEEAVPDAGAVEDPQQAELEDLLAAEGLLAHAKSSQELNRGWILVGFPDDGNRLALLERFLSGFVHPKARPEPKARQLKTEAEVIAPRPAEEVEPLVRQPGGYDLHFRLNLTLDESIRRACGRRIDPATNLEYHIEDMPPPNKKAVIYERLVPADSLEKSTGTLTERIHCFDVAQPEVEEILEHFGPFPDVPRLVEVNAMSSSDETFEAVEEKVALLLQRKRAEIAQAEEAARAAQAEEEAAAPVEPETADADNADAAAAAADAPPADAAPADADAAENTDPPPEPPFQAVQLSELPSYVGKIEDEVFNLLMEEWSELQGDLVSSLQQLFNWHRSHLADFKSGLFGMKQRFSEFVQRSDGKQDMVDDFVERFNLFTEEYPEMRKQEPTKAELHLRAEELHQRLKAEVEKQSSANLEQLEVMQTSRWLESQTEVLASQVQHAVQLEVKRYHACCQLLSDFYYSALCLGLPEEHEAPPKVDIFAPPEPEEVPDPKKKKDDKKKKPGDAPEEPEISPEEKAAARLCKYIPDEESGGEGRWEFPFLAELMEQASKAVWKLEDFTPPSIEVPEEEEKEDPKAKAKAKGKAKAKEKPKKEEEAEKPPPQPAPALFVDLQQALLAERVTFRQRLQMIQGWAIRRLHQAASSTKSTFRDLNDWILLRRHKDLEAVTSLVDVLKEQVESEDFIKTKLCVKNAHLHQRPNTLLRAPKPEKVPPEVEGVAPFRWTMEQLDLLFEVIASAAAAISPSCRVLPNYTLLRILEQLTSADGGDKRTVKVPANWRNCGEAKLKQMLAAFDHPYSGSCIDLVDFLFHMLLLHSPVGWPSLNTLMEVRRVLEAQAPRGAIWPDFYVPGHVVESLPLFEESGEESFAKKFKPITTLAPNMFDRPGAQLKWVAKVLQRYRAPSGEHEAWSVEVAWYDYRVQRHEDSERLVEMLDDVRSTPTDTPRQPVDNIPALLGHEENENPDDAVSTGGQSTWSTGRPEKPRPEEPAPVDLPEDHISVRQLMAYLCQGTTTEEGLARAFAVLSPSTVVASNTLPLETAHRTIFSLGARPLPGSSSGDGRPPFPAVQKFSEELDSKYDGNTKATAAVGKTEAFELIKALSLGRRHRRAEVEKIFPKVK